MRIAALLTCHNRRDKTMSCLAALHACDRPLHTSVDVFLTDDASTDGTAEAVRQSYPDVRILRGNGSLFWNGGMRMAFDAAMKDGYDAYLWLNDDTMLFTYTLHRLIDTWKRIAERDSDHPIVIGSTQDPVSGEHTYGGRRRPLRWRMRHDLVPPQDKPLECETMNGNCVLIPAAVAQRVGNLDSGFSHSMGDFDYGLRARKAGFRILVMSGFAGTCSKNQISGTCNAEPMSLRQRLHKIMQPKGLPIQSWRIYTRRHGGRLWFAFWLWPYVKVIAKSIMKR